MLLIPTAGSLGFAAGEAFPRWGNSSPRFGALWETSMHNQKDPLHALILLGDFTGIKKHLSQGDLPHGLSPTSLLAALMSAARNGQHQCLAALLAALPRDHDPASPPPPGLRDYSRSPPTIAGALQLAAHYGHEECVRLLIPACSEEHDLSTALVIASDQGRLACIQALIPSVAKDAVNALVLVARFGHGACVKSLMERSDPASINDALAEASTHGHADCARLLLPLADPLAHGSRALRRAAERGHMATVELLLPHSDARAVGRRGLDAAASARNEGHGALALLIEHLLAAQERDVLLDASCSPSAASSSSASSRMRL